MRLNKCVTGGTPFIRYLAAMLLIMAIANTTGNCEEPQKDWLAIPSEVEVKTLEITPSYNGVSYEGKFRLINHGKDSLELFCSEAPVNQRFFPNSVQFQVLINGAWTRVPTTGGPKSTLCDIPSGMPCELQVNLYPFREQDEPITARVIFNWDKFPSQPFKLDWKSDRKAGKFLAAKKAHADRLRAYFLKSGFRPELLKGDDFPARLVNDMISRVANSGEAGKWIKLFNKGKMEMEESITRKDDVSITFTFSSASGGYIGVFKWNPEMLNRELLRKLRRKDGFAKVSVDEKSGKYTGLTIFINPDDPIDVKSPNLDYIVRPFEMTLGVHLDESVAESLPVLKDGESEKALDSVMDFLEGCLNR